MKITNVNRVSFGVLNRRITDFYLTGKLDMWKGETKKSTIEIFKEFINNKLSSKYCILKDKETGNVVTKIVYYDKDGKVIPKVR